MDALDKDWLLLIEKHGSLSPTSMADRMRLDWLVDMGLASREEQLYNPELGSRPQPRYRLTERGKKHLEKG